MADVRVLEVGPENPLPNRITQQSLSLANDNGAWKVSDEDSAFIIEAGADETYLEYDEDLLDEAPDELTTEDNWSSIGNWNDSDEDE